MTIRFVRWPRGLRAFNFPERDARASNGYRARRRTLMHERSGAAIPPACRPTVTTLDVAGQFLEVPVEFRRVGVFQFDVRR